MWILSRNLCADIKVLAALHGGASGLSSRKESAVRSAPGPWGALEHGDSSDGREGEGRSGEASPTE
ncbi:MAG: hypothetical protein U1A78_20720 [Polyangia bacterium]